MDLWSHDRFTFPLPATHKFPLTKYARLRARLEADGIARPDEIHECEPVPWDWIEAVQQRALVERLRAGTLSVREQRGLGLPWSAALVERARRTTAGTVAAARRALARGVGMNLGGGTHHAGYDFARGYCLFNDVAVALARVRADGDARRALVVDCDVHQGDGTAQALAADPDAFTVSLHGARNYPFQRIPSDLDVDLPSGTGDRDYLRALDDALDTALPLARPEVAFYLAGADPFEGDRLGRLALTKAGLRARDELVVERLRAAGAAVVVVLAGGYARDVADTVDINAATAAVVAAADVRDGAAARDLPRAWVAKASRGTGNAPRAVTAWRSRPRRCAGRATCCPGARPAAAARSRRGRRSCRGPASSARRPRSCSRSCRTSCTCRASRR